MAKPKTGKEGKLLRFEEHEEAGCCSITPERLLERILEEIKDESNPITGMTVLYYRENSEGGYTLGYQNAHMPAPWCFMLAEWYKMKLRQDHWADFEDEM